MLAYGHSTSSMERTTDDALGDQLLNESFCEMGTSSVLDPAADSWEQDYSDDWESAPNGETLPDGEGSTSTTALHPDDLVADGVIGAEYRSMKLLKMEAASATPPRDPYHGRSSEPKLAREPPRESFNLMVVGEAGLGKTTLLESFFKSFKVRPRSRALSLATPSETPPPSPPLSAPPPHPSSPPRLCDRTTTRPSPSSSARRRTR